MRRRHAMPFGAEVDAAGARFRLWAPGARRVELDLTHPRGRANLPMYPTGDGWHAATIEGLAAGASYLYRIDEATLVPDPASRCNPKDVHAASLLVDPLDFDWPDDKWTGRAWEQAVIYELHIGTFTPEGTFTAAIERLGYLATLGVTAIEVMPVAEFPGKRNWGYDGVLPFAPDSAYGTPSDLKRLVAAAHAHGLSMILDVVYNHFGPEGNYLHSYAPQFFNARHQTPWGAAINFDGEGSGTVRDFFTHNALYWLEEFHFDGLRLDAVHAIPDESAPDIVEQIAQAVRRGPGRQRHIHLVLENDRNDVRYLERTQSQAPALADAQWNDDFHHALHVIVTGEKDGYYADYADRPLWRLGRALAEGFIYQGEPSPHRGGEPRGERSSHLPPVAFVDFLQCHDQVGNRAFGERLCAIAKPAPLKLATACLLLAPAVPMLFMGEEFAASTPFRFFCDFGPDLAAAVREGRRKEFACFERFDDPQARASIPDPGANATFLASKLAWDEIGQPGHAEWLSLYSELLRCRRFHIVPHLAGGAHEGAFQLVGGSGLAVEWTLGDGARLHMRVNFSGQEIECESPPGERIFSSGVPIARDGLAAWGGAWSLELADA